MSDQTMFVQFPHPGREHRPAGKEMPWNTGDHARKFLVSQADFVDDGRVESGSIGFWGEWEPQSRVVAEFRGRAPQAPRYVHEPYLQVPTDEGQRQNTDPLVFGDCFRYSNCRQPTNRKLRHLAPGSLVLFGSTVAGEFVLDTFLVVGGHRDYFVPDSADIDCPQGVQDVVLEPLRRGDPPKGAWRTELRLYEGVSYGSYSEGPYSFVPCQPWEEGSAGFPRPVIRLDSEWIKPSCFARLAPYLPHRRSSMICGMRSFGK